MGKNHFEVEGSVKEIHKEMVDFGKGPTPHLVMTVKEEGDYGKDVAVNFWGDNAKSLGNTDLGVIVKVSGSMKSRKNKFMGKDGKEKTMFNTSLSGKDLNVVGLLSESAMTEPPGPEVEIPF